MDVLWAMSLLGLVFLPVLVAALERFGLWAGDRGRLPWRRKRVGMRVSATGFEELEAPVLMEVDLVDNRTVPRKRLPDR